MDFDLFVIGGGSAGVRCARIAAGHGARVGIAEMDETRGRATADALAAGTGNETLFVRTDVRRKEDNVEMIAHAVDASGTRGRARGRSRRTWSIGARSPTLQSADVLPSP